MLTFIFTEVNLMDVLKMVHLSGSTSSSPDKSMSCMLHVPQQHKQHVCPTDDLQKLNILLYEVLKYMGSCSLIHIINEHICIYKHS